MKLIATAISGFLMLASCGPEPATDPNYGQNTPIPCEEDMECWDCETMGNRICGPNADD